MIVFNPCHLIFLVLTEYSSRLLMTMLFLLTLLLTALPGKASEQTGFTSPSQEITLRSMPFYNSAILRSWWEPIRQHIYTKTGIIIRISPSTDYPAILSDSANKQYDLYLAPDHLTPLMIEQYQLKPLAIINQDTGPLLIHSKNLKLKTIAELRNKCVAMPHEIALMSILGKEWLAERGLNPFVDYQAMHLNTLQEAAMKVFSGQCDAAIVAGNLFENFPATMKNKVIGIEISMAGQNLKGFNILAKTDLNNALFNTIQQAMLSFGTTEATTQYLSDPLYAQPTILDQKTLNYYEQRFQYLKPLLQRYLLEK